MLKCKHFIKWKLCLKILTLTKTLAEKPPLHQAVTSSVSCWPSGVKYSIPVIWVRVSEGATHTSFEVWEQASFKGYFHIFSSNLCEIRLECVKVNILQMETQISENFNFDNQLWQKAPPPKAVTSSVSTGHLVSSIYSCHSESSEGATHTSFEVNNRQVLMVILYL